MSAAEKLPTPAAATPADVERLTDSPDWAEHHDLAVMEARVEADGRAMTTVERIAFSNGVMWLVNHGLASDWPPPAPPKPGPVPLPCSPATIFNLVGNKPAPSPKPFPVLTCAKDVKPKEVEYLWPGRILRSRIQVFMGMPGQGKSTLMSWFAATVSSGAAWPDAPGYAERGSVIILQAEESKSEDIAGRLEGYGADTSKIHYLDGVGLVDGRRRRFDLARDCDVLENAMDRIGDVRAVIFDPLGSFLGDGSNKSEDDVRDALEPLKLLAERREVAMLIVAHPNKKGDQDMIHRLAGSQAIAALARAVWFVSEDPNDPTRRMLSFVKGNPKGLNRKPLAWAETDDKQLVFDSDAGDMRARHVEFLLQHNLKQEALQARRRGPKPSSSATAEAKILEALATGPMLRTRLKEVVVCDDISDSSFGKALKRLEADGKVVRTKSGGSRKGVGFQLPDVVVGPPSGQGDGAETDPSGLRADSGGAGVGVETARNPGKTE